MRTPSLPPLYHPAAVGDGQVLEVPKRLPADLRPVANPQPGNPAADQSHDQVLLAIKQIAGDAPYDQPETARPRQERESLPATQNTPQVTEPAPARTPAPDEPEELNQEIAYEVIEGTVRYLYQVPHAGGSVATDTGGQHLLRVGPDGELERDDNGGVQLIWVDIDGFECDPPQPNDAPSGRLDRLLNRVGTRGRTAEDEQPKPQMYDEAGVPITDMEVVKAGAPTSSSNRRRGLKVVALLGGVSFAFGAMVLVVGIVWGSSRVPAAGSISAVEADEYRLTSFPVEQAAAFGADYLRVCLTHGDGTQVAERAAALEAMASPIAAKGCGWESGGNTQQPDSVTFNGEVSEIEGFKTGQAAYLGYNVTMDGERLSYNVPVWIGATEGGGQSTQVIGDIGVASTIPNGEAPNRQPLSGSDVTLAGQLNTSVLQPFFTAWAASDTRQLNLMLAQDASTSARTGMDGVVTRPILESVMAFTDRANVTGEAVDYIDGDTATVETAVVWDVMASKSSQTTGYRVDMVMEGGQWRVVDVSPGLASSQGGSNSRASNGSTSGRAGNAGTGAGSSLGGVSNLESSAGEGYGLDSDTDDQDQDQDQADSPPTGQTTNNPTP